VYARYREAVVQMYTELFNQHRDPLSDDFQREKRKLEGVERYLVQLWRDSLSGLRAG
jgi:ribosomal protein S17E